MTWLSLAASLGASHAYLADPSDPLVDSIGSADLTLHHGDLPTRTGCRGWEFGGGRYLWAHTTVSEFGSWEATFRTFTSLDYQAMLGVRGDGGTHACNLAANLDDQLWHYCDDAADTGTDSATTDPADDKLDDRWHHIVAVRASTTSRKLYVDGALVATNTATKTVGTQNVIIIGGTVRSDGTGRGQPWQGELRQCAIYDGVFLDEDDVAALATYRKCPGIGWRYGLHMGNNSGFSIG